MNTINDLISVVEPGMAALRASTRKSVHLMVRDGWEGLYLACLESAYEPRGSVEVGSRQPLHARSAGVVLLAAMPEYEMDRYISDCLAADGTAVYTLAPPEVVSEDVRLTQRRGFAAGIEPRVVGWGSVAVPILNGHLQVWAALAAAGSSASMESVTTTEMAEQARAAADQISRDLQAASLP